MYLLWDLTYVLQLLIVYKYFLSGLNYETCVFNCFMFQIF